ELRAWPDFSRPAARKLFRAIQRSIASLVRDWRTREQLRQLVVKETVSLGEKRFVSILEVDGERLLIGGGVNTVRLLKRLDRRCRDSKSGEKGSADGAACGGAGRRSEVTPGHQTSGNAE